MLFLYSFGEKLDLTRFRKQATHYIGQMREIDFTLDLPNYRVCVEISGVDNSTEHICTVSVADIERDGNGEITRHNNIFLLRDTRFKENKDIKNIFENANQNNQDFRLNFISSSAEQTSDKICLIIKLLHKINYLKEFL